MKFYTTGAARTSGTEIITQPEIPVTAVADAIVSREPITEGGMVARVNELHRSGIVQQCAELFSIVAQLKAEVMRKHEVTWKQYVEKNFAFSLATADNYARIGRGQPTVLTALGAVRHLHPSGQPGHKAHTRKTISKEEMANATEADTIQKPTAPMKEETTIEDALKTLIKVTMSGNSRHSKIVSAVREARGRVTKLNNQLIEARNDLARAEAAVMKALKELQADGPAH